jgi:hypothetical protein
MRSNVRQALIEPPLSTGERSFNEQKPGKCGRKGENAARVPAALKAN